MKIKGFGITTEERILLFEEKIGFKLPKDYREFLKNCNGGKPEIRNSFFEVIGVENFPIILTVLYGLDVGSISEIFDLNYYIDSFYYQQEIPEKSILIGHDPGGAELMLLAEEGREGIYFIDSSFGLSENLEEQIVIIDNEEIYEYKFYLIAKTFQEFLDNATDYFEGAFDELDDE